jgi:hypothetical protein
MYWAGPVPTGFANPGDDGPTRDDGLRRPTRKG